MMLPSSASTSTWVLPDLAGSRMANDQTSLPRRRSRVRVWMTPFGILDSANVRAESSVIFACATSESGTVRRYEGVCVDACMLCCVTFFVLSTGVGLWAAATPAPRANADRTMLATVFMILFPPSMMTATWSPTEAGKSPAASLSNEQPARDQPGAGFVRPAGETDDPVDEQFVQPAFQKKGPVENHCLSRA